MQFEHKPAKNNDRAANRVLLLKQTSVDTGWQS
jgi:hypothetical protein